MNLHSHYLDNITFFLTDIHNYLHFYYFVISRTFIHFFKFFFTSCH